MGAQHTPGPWRISEQSSTIIKRDFRFIGDEGGELVASAHGMDGSGFYVSCADAEANARLIAAAPDLLAALIYYRDNCTGAEPSISAFHQMLDQSVAKATGSAT